MASPGIMNKFWSFLHNRRPFPIPQNAPKLLERSRHEISDANYPKHRTFPDKFFLVHVPNHRRSVTGAQNSWKGEFVRRTPQHQEYRDSLARPAKEGQSGSSWFVYHIFECHAALEISQTIPLLQTFLL